MIMSVMEKFNWTFPQIGGKREMLGVVPDYFSEEDIRLFKEGGHKHLYRKFGAHVMTLNHLIGTYFAVWAPNARRVSVVGNFNHWKPKNHSLTPRQDNSGVWEGFVPGVVEGDLYKFHIISKRKLRGELKADPYAQSCETAPKTASIIHDGKYTWGDEAWINGRAESGFLEKPVSVYEIHLGSWKRGPDNQFLNYRQMADNLIPYIKKMGFTHVELMPVMEHPFFGSWGYQALSYFAPTARYGSPEDLKYLIDQLHQNGIGVLLDWVASHFPYDRHGLANFDGTPLYENKELHPDWKSCVFNLGRHQTVDFLVSSAMYWFEQFHVDGLRVDAVASMLYLDYSRSEGQWKPNFFGGTENIEAVSFIRYLNEAIKDEYPDAHIIAEDSTAWPNVSKSSAVGGLSFDMKWNMGWMHDTLKYFRRDFKDRLKHHDEISFCLHYAFSEHFMLSLSHDEVVYEKGSLLGKMPGTDEEKFAGLRTLYGYMYGHPGKKLIFMGGELAQWSEWNHDGELDWDMLKYDRHCHIQNWVKDLNVLYAEQPALHQNESDARYFRWLDMGKKGNGVFAFLRLDKKEEGGILVLCNFSNKAIKRYRIGDLNSGDWSVCLSSDCSQYGGGETSIINDDLCSFNLAPLSVAFLKKS